MLLWGFQLSLDEEMCTSTLTVVIGFKDSLRRCSILSTKSFALLLCSMSKACAS